MNDDLQKRLGLCLFFCRVGVFIVFLVWTINKFIRPEHGAGIMKSFYLIPGLTESLILAFAAFELVMCLLLLTGFYKTATRAFFVFLSFMSIFTPRALNGMKNGIFEGWHTILFFSAFCLLACSIIMFLLREYDTRYSLADSLKAKKLSSNNDSKVMNNNIENRLAWSLLFCRVGVFIVFLVWTINKFLRPEHGVEMMQTYYLIPSVPEGLILAFGIFELLMVTLLLLGLYKVWVRGFFLFLSVLAVSVPQVLKGYVDVFLHGPHPTILFFTGFCVFACCFTIFYLRDYDTKLSLGKS